MITLIKWNGNKERVTKVILEKKGKSKKKDDEFVKDEILKMKKNKEKIVVEKIKKNIVTTTR
jgi:hypothetical protein